MGAIVSKEQHERIMTMIAEGKSYADCVTGGEAMQVDGKGYFVQPTIFDDVPPESQIAREEIFGPVLSVIPFDSEDEAVAMRSIVSWASVWTGTSRAHRVSRRLQAGTVSVNTVDALSPMTPFGGFKQSGYGRDLSLHALDKYTALKTTWIKY